MNDKVEMLATKFAHLCREHGLEPAGFTDDAAVLLCSKHPGPEVEAQFQHLMPQGKSVKFVVGPSGETIMRLKIGLAALGVTFEGMSGDNDGHFVLHMHIDNSDSPVTSLNSPIWQATIGKMMSEPGVQSCDIQLERQVTETYLIRRGG